MNPVILTSLNFIIENKCHEKSLWTIHKRLIFFILKKIYMYIRNKASNSGLVSNPKKYIIRGLTN